MPFPGLIPLLVKAAPVVAAGVGDIFSNTKGARTSAPVIAPEFKSLSDMLRNRALSGLRSSMDLGGLTAGGINNINQAFGGVQQAVQNNLTSRGLGTSPVAGAVDANLQIARGGNIADFLNTVPQLQRQFQTQDINNASNVLRFGTGNVSPGSAVASGIGSAAEMLAYLRGEGLI